MSSSDGSGGRQLRLELAVNDFEHFLTADKGLSVTTRECYVRHVLPFLTEVGVHGRCGRPRRRVSSARAFVRDGSWWPILAAVVEADCDGDQVVSGVRMDVGLDGLRSEARGWCGGDPPVRPPSQGAAR